jgi:diguanylate cyclase (GGDEF)-like protein
MPKNAFTLGLNKHTLMLVSASILLGLLFFSLLLIDQVNLVNGLFLGLLLAIGLLNLVMYFYTHSFRFLIYSAFVFFVSLALAAVYNVGNDYLWPNITWLKQHSLALFVNVSLILSLLFSYFLLNIKSHSKALRLLLKLASAIILVNLIAGFYLTKTAINFNVILVLIIGCTVNLTTGLSLWSKGVTIAKNYTFAWSALLLSICLLGLESFYPMGIPSSILLLGAVVKISVITLTLMFSYHQEKQNLLLAEIKILENQNLELQMLTEKKAIQESSTEDLEYKVQERTLELEIALRELSETNLELEKKNTLDALTGIRNRSYFDKKYQAEIRRSRREQTQLSIVMLDIDHFKSVNDQYGHLVGDECIKEVANTIDGALKRPSDHVCRYGGEEFALILPSTDLAGAISLVEQIRLKIAGTTITVNDSKVNITVSAGVASAIAELSQAEDTLLALADKQLYKAKNAGRNKVIGFDLNAS